MRLNTHTAAPAILSDRFGAPLPTLFTVGEVARALRVSDETIRRRVLDGSIAAVQLGGIRRIPAAELERVLRVRQ